MNEQPCLYCNSDPLSHSFRKVRCYESNPETHVIKLDEERAVSTYDTRVSEAKLYNNPRSIIHHMEKHLIMDTNNLWEWHIDFRDAQTRHYAAFGTVYALCKWINSEKRGLCRGLTNIVVLNGVKVLVYPLIVASRLFLPRHIQVVVKEY